MSRDPRSGFALPLTIFLIAIVSLMLTTAFTRVQTDRRIGHSSGASVNAMAIAKASLQNYLGTRTSRPANGDSVRVNMTGGYADVIAQVVRRPADTLANWLFVVRSVGYVIDPTQGADPQAVRTIAQFAQWQTGRMDVLASFTAINGLTNTGGNGEFTGNDGCGTLPAVNAIRVHSTGAPTLSPYTSNGASPNVLASGTKAATATATNIDWKALTGGGFTPDYTSQNDVRVNDNTYPTQLILSDSAVLNDPAGGGFTIGWGLIIAPGNLWVTGDNVQWYGVVLVGGTITFNANTQRFDGLVVSGLDEQLGVAVGTGGFTTGSKNLDIDYDSCRITDALARLTGFAPLTNAWVDNWATY